MEFIYVDLMLLLIFSLFIGIFLYKKRKKLKIESKIFVLYKTKTGIKFINSFSKNFSGFLHVLSWFVIAFGFIAMFFAVFLFYRSIELIATMVTVLKIPPLMPLVPYLPQIFKLPLPPFYFSYWILIILAVAVTHEFAHGIFASLYKLKIKSTGFGFLGPFLLAFVEPDEKAMQKRKPKNQLAIFAAGSFSNFVFAVIFLLLLQLFFFLCYQPAGVVGYLYSFQSINATAIKNIGEYSLESFLNLNEKELENIFNKTETGLLELKTKDNKTYYLTFELASLAKQSKNRSNQIIAYQDTPALKANLTGAIQKINDVEIKDITDINLIIKKYKPGDTIIIQTTEKKYTITLAEHPQNKSLGYLGIGFPMANGANLFMARLLSPFFSPYINASPKFNEDLLMFIKDLLFWLVIISFSVAIINMLPLTFLDGGKFIYVAALGLTKSKKIAEIVFKITTFIVLMILLILTLAWLSRIL
ncbi:MAG: site-2 protease family protein [Candidatus Pacearchaeota archaeon]|nr:site-2 protease family protein [Candidatus Pacearchaeota archaeon]